NKQRTDFSVTRNKVERAHRDPGAMQQPDGLKSNKRCLFGWLRHDGVAGGERRGNLPGEDGQRKIPGTDADEYPASSHAQLIGFACRAWQGLRREKMAGVLRVEPAIVDRLAHFGNAVVDRLAPFALQKGDQATTILLKQVAGTFERGSALGDRG